jgi:hypothetical protein
LIRPVTQRTVGFPNGECVRASYATLLGIPIESIPRLDPGAWGDAQHSAERAWLRSVGYTLREIAVDPPNELPDDFLAAMPETYHLMSGISPRGNGHRVVGYAGRVAWDPHPSRAGLSTVYAVGFVVPVEEDHAS